MVVADSSVVDLMDSLLYVQKDRKSKMLFKQESLPSSKSTKDSIPVLFSANRVSIPEFICPAKVRRAIESRNYGFC